ncbi:hypothetical protein LJC72_12580 [Bacteroides sp. OttesenSCG-928-D19]|nr:hypothetical protein [Bacteroides sp. OttesenSCG-928-D19]
MKKIILLFCSLVSLLSCTMKKQATNEQAESTKMQFDSIIVVPTFDWRLEEVVNCFCIKKKFEDFYTSGIGRKKREPLYIKPYESGFYGGYNLLSSGEKDECWCSGQMIIYNHEYPWMYDNKTDYFIEITVYNSGIPVFGSIEIGSTKNLLEQTIGTKYCKKKDNLIIYKLDSLNIIALFYIQNDKIGAFRLGRYKSEVLLNIDNYIEDLSNQVEPCELLEARTHQ